MWSRIPPWPTWSNEALLKASTFARVILWSLLLNRAPKPPQPRRPMEPLLLQPEPQGLPRPPLLLQQVPQWVLILLVRQHQLRPQLLRLPPWAPIRLVHQRQLRPQRHLRLPPWALIRLAPHHPRHLQLVALRHHQAQRTPLVRHHRPPSDRRHPLVA